MLDGAVAVLKEYSYLRLRISGHTDNVGDPEDNLKLSTDRAGAVRDYMVSQGIAAHRLETFGHGQSKPIGNNSTEEGRARNRRIEFSIEEGPSN